MTLTVVILALNEARHIERCITSVKSVAERVIVVDSGSNDDTCAIAARMGAEVLHNKWVNHATQFNWAIDNAGITTVWTMRLDADEIVMPALADSLRTAMTTPGIESGFVINRRMHFLGRWIRWGGIYPHKVVRVWRTGKGRVENRWMDEHVLVDGAVVPIKGDIADINLNNVGWWTAKHNGYATLEAIDQLSARERDQPDTNGTMGSQAQLKRWIKRNIYAKLPLGVRPLVFFVARYFLLLGFLDGVRGLAFYSLQVLWYRLLVDIKIYELRTQMRSRGQCLATVVKDEYGLDI